MMTALIPRLKAMGIPAASSNMIRVNETLCDCCIEWVEFSRCNCGGKEFRLTEQIKTNKNERI